MKVTFYSVRSVEMPFVKGWSHSGLQNSNPLSSEVQTAKAKFDNLGACELYAARGAA